MPARLKLPPTCPTTRHPSCGDGLRAMIERLRWRRLVQDGVPSRMPQVYREAAASSCWPTVKALPLSAADNPSNRGTARRAQS